MSGNPVVIQIPPASNVNLTPGEQFQFNITTACTICFGTNTHFPHLSGKSFNPPLGTFGPYTAPSVNTQIPYNVVAPPGNCNPTGIQGTGSVIHVGSGK